MSTSNISLKKVFPRAEGSSWILSIGRLAALFFIMVLMTFLTRSPEHGFVFLNISNLLNVFRNASILIIIGIGETIVLTAKDVDLSIGSMISLTSVVAAIMMNKLGLPVPIAIISSLIIGILLGLVNGLLITYVGLPPFIATFGMLWVLFGFAYLILRGAVVYGFPESFRFIGIGALFGIPMPIIIMAVIFVLSYLLLHYSTLGRRFFATGANPEAAKMSGIKVNQIVITAYVISGFLSALAGLVLIAYTNGSDNVIGSGYLLPVMAIVVMGGTSLAGGAGSLIGTLIAALIMAVINNGMNILAVPGAWQKLVVGIMIISAVLLDQWVRKSNN